MMKKLSIILIIAMLLAGCGTKGGQLGKEKGEIFSWEKYGNTPGNISNGAIVAKDKDWFYYGDVLNKGIYRVDKDLKNKEKIFGTGATVNVLGDWIYTENVGQGGYVRMKKDGSDIEQITDVLGDYLNVGDSGIYFVERAQGVISANVDEKDNLVVNDQREGGGIYRIDEKKKKNIKLSEDRGKYLTLSGDWLYYINESDKFSLYRMKTDGSKREKMTDTPGEYMVLDGEWIYFRHYVNGNEVYRIKTDGSEESKILEGKGTIQQLNAYNGWIYYVAQDVANQEDNNKETVQYQIFKMKSDGTNQSVIYEGLGTLVNIIDEHLYFLRSSNNGYEYVRIKNDGSGEQVVHEIK